ncbi:MAG TPA: sugar ABC transporter substrate-binding protein [Vicinamibacterales bacterium]|nr:sugar ABC transporter substrate-binding protein [Vicinamibacterales bacterium]
MKLTPAIPAVTALVLAASLVAGCNRGGSEKKTIALVPKAMDSEFWLAVRDGAQKAVEGRTDVTLSVLAPDREINVDQQVAILEDQIQRGAKALVVAPAGSAQVAPVLQNAIGRGIPVILVDTDAPLPGKSSYAGTDNRAGGALAAKHVIERVGTGKIAIISGVPGNQSQDDRAAGFLETIATAPGLQVVARQPANSERSLGLTVMENILTAHPDIKAVFATNDQMALGAVEAIVARKSQAGIIVVGFDATAEAVQAIVEGRMSASVAQRPFEMGRRSVEAALALIEGRPVEARIDTGTELVTSANAAKYRK